MCLPIPPLAENGTCMSRLTEEGLEPPPLSPRRAAAPVDSGTWGHFCPASAISATRHVPNFGTPGEIRTLSVHRVGTPS